MKLRIKGNTMRLRVSRSELAQLIETGRLSETIYFGPRAGAELDYLLVTSDSRVLVDVEASTGRVKVILPTAMAQSWSRTDQVGLSGTVDLGIRGTLSVLIEKDFACLDGAAEENGDSFARPQDAPAC